MRVENGRLIYDNGKDLGAVYQEVDGYYVFWPEVDGCWEACTLRAIADILDKMNEPWDKIIQEAFREH